MSYLDTCVIISYGFENDRNHDEAVKLIKEIKSDGRFYSSTLTLTELHCVLSRRMHQYRLPPGIEQIADEGVRLKAVVLYLLQILDITIPPDDPGVIDLGKFKLFHRFYESIQLAKDVKLKTLDTMHLAYANQLKNKGNVKNFVTLDKEILKNKEKIKTTTGLNVLP